MGRTETITFTIPGKPIGKPRMTQRDKWYKRKATTDYWEWKELVKSIATNVPPAAQVVSLSWIAYFTPPASWSAKRRIAVIGQLHRSKPDRDNIDKALLDALFDDDAAIAAGSLEKRWSENARLEVTIIRNRSLADV